MTVALINGSPKRKDSASGVLLEDLRARLPDTVQVEELPLHAAALPAEAPDQLRKAEAWAFSFPLYVDGLPSHLLSCLMALEEALAGDPGNPGRLVCGIVNCGFYEGDQAELALKVLENWCARIGVTWGGGLGVGGGGAVAGLPPGKGPMTPVSRELAALGERIARGEAGENRFVSIAFPRFLYKLAAQMGWRKAIKDSGGKTKDLGRQIME